MTNVAETVLAVVKSVQLALQILYSLAITEWHFPQTCTFTNGSYYDFIIIGGGSAGSILAERLTANSSYSAILIEAGGYSPIESDMAGIFTALPSSVFDYNMTSENDNYTAQYLQNGCVELTAGKMLGGSGALDHMIHVHGDPHDFDYYWTSEIGDNSWNYSNIFPYMIKQETLMDSTLLSDATYSSVHGTSGPVKITRQTHSSNEGIFAAAVELGHNLVYDTTSNTSTKGIAEPLLQIYNNQRQSNAITYLGKAIGRSNLCLALSTTATKILIEDGVARGVQVVDSSGDTYVIYANLEVIVSAGALNSPKLLMLSGIGNSTHLESLGIDVVVDLPVGDNLQDHPSASFMFQMESDSSTTPATNPFNFPTPMTCLYASLNSTQLYPDYQDIILRFPYESTAFVQLCSNCFKYKDEICNKWYAASVGRDTIFVVHNLMIPKSRGYVRLASADYTDNVKVTLGTYTDTDGADLKLMAKTLADFYRFNSTTYFKSINATFVDLGLCTDYTFASDEYWECYALKMSAGMWHYSGTCAIGSVVDTSLRVKNVTNLRVIDASAMPTLVSGNIRGTVDMVSERGASMILEYYDIEV